MSQNKHKVFLVVLSLCLVVLLSIFGIRTIIDNLKYETNRDTRFDSPYGNSSIILRYDYVSRPFLFYNNIQIFSYQKGGFNENVTWHIDWISENEVRLYMDSLGEKFAEEYYVSLPTNQ